MTDSNETTANETTDWAHVWPALVELRKDEVFRTRFEYANQLLRVSPVERPDTAFSYVVSLLQARYPEVPRKELAGVVEAVFRARKTRAELAGPGADPAAQPGVGSDET